MRSLGRRPRGVPRLGSGAAVGLRWLLTLAALAALLSGCATPAASADRALLEAAERGDDQAVAALLGRGADPHAEDSRGRTPLVAASYRNHLAAAAVLLDAGADPNRKDHTEQSAYLIATSEVGDDPALLDLMLSHGADVTDLDSFGGTGLIRAADRGYPRVVTRLLDTDVSVDHVNQLGWAALHEAVILGDGGPSYLAVVSLLIDAGADVNLRSQRDGATPLTHALERGYEELAEMLTRAGAMP